MVVRRQWRSPLSILRINLIFLVEVKRLGEDFLSCRRWIQICGTSSPHYNDSINERVTSNEPLAMRLQKSKYCDALWSLRGTSLMMRNDR